MSDASTQPILTICVPTYERPELLARALTSVIDQAGSDDAAQVELLVSDNSPAVSGPVVQAQLPRWPGPSTYLPNEPTIGPIANFNQCLTRARGLFVVFLHDDDYLLPGGVPAILQALSLAGDDRVLLFGVDVVDSQGHLRRHQAFRARRRLSPTAALKQLLSESSFVRIPSIVIRRDVFESVGYFDEGVGNPADFELLIRIFAAYGLRCEPTTVAAYSVHLDAASSGMFRAETIATVMMIFDRARDLKALPDHVVTRCEADWLHQFVLGGTYRQLRIGDLAGARRTLSLLQLPAVAALGPSRRWRPVRWLFEGLMRLPRPVVARTMIVVGRASPERLWPPW